MEFRKITAIIHADRLEDVEAVLLELGVVGAAVKKVQGHGGYRNFIGSAWLLSHVEVEIFIATTSRGDCGCYPGNNAFRW